MATITPTITLVDPKRTSITWLGVGPGDVGAPVDLSTSTWRSVQLIPSAIGVPATSLTMEVSNDGANTWFSSGITTTSQIAAGVLINFDNRARAIRPVAVGGGTTTYDVFMWAVNQA